MSNKKKSIRDLALVMGLEKTQYNLSFLSETVRNEAIKVLKNVKEP